MNHQTFGWWEDRPSEPANYIEDCPISKPALLSDRADFSLWWIKGRNVIEISNSNPYIPSKQFLAQIREQMSGPEISYYENTIASALKSCIIPLLQKKIYFLNPKKWKKHYFMAKIWVKFECKYMKCRKQTTVGYTVVFSTFLTIFFLKRTM